MFKVDKNIILMSKEFQPFVLLEDIVDRKFSNVLKPKNITVSYVLEQSKPKRYEHDILPIENIKTEIKEEEYSEHIEDITPTVNGHISSPREPQDVTTCGNQVLESVEYQSASGIIDKQSTSVKEESESSSILSNVQPPREAQTTSVTVAEYSEDCSSLDLHLSPESVDNHDNTDCENENMICSSKNQSERNSQGFNVSLDSSSVQSSICSLDISNSNEHISSDQQCSPDLFEESSERNVQGSTLTSPSCCSVYPSLSSDLSHHTGEDNRERQEEWNSQDLSMVSQRLRVRSKQAKRLILEVIRKRQMEDETLEAFKKRLRRM